MVPVQAIAEHKGEFFAFVEKGGQIKLRKVKIGENNETHVQILEGLAEGDQVALDARLRAAAEFKLDDQEPGHRARPRPNGRCTPARVLQSPPALP